MSCVMSTNCAFGAMPNMTPFMIPTNGSARPKSVVSVIIISLASGTVRIATVRRLRRPVPPRPETMRRVYLDSNATTPLRPEVVAAMMPVFTEHFGNASSIHWFGQHAKSLIDDARQHLAKLIHAETAEIVFLSGGTEADNLAIRGIAESQKSAGRHIITSQIEHHAVLHTCKDLEKQGYEITWLPLSHDGMVNPADVRKAIRKDTILISIMHANNEIGTIQPIDEIGKIAAEADVYFHSDGVQSTGKIPVNVKSLGIDLYSMSAHKIHGPKGVGALFVKKGSALN